MLSMIGFADDKDGVWNSSTHKVAFLCLHWKGSEVNEGVWRRCGPLSLITVKYDAVNRCKHFCFNCNLVRRIGLQFTYFPKARKHITDHEFNTVSPKFCRSWTMILAGFNAAFGGKITWNHFWIRNKLSRPLQLPNKRIVIQFWNSQFSTVSHTRYSRNVGVTRQIPWCQFCALNIAINIQFYSSCSYWQCCCVIERSVGAQVWCKASVTVVISVSYCPSV